MDLVSFLNFAFFLNSELIPTILSIKKKKIKNQDLVPSSNVFFL